MKQIITIPTNDQGIGQPENPYTDATYLRSEAIAFHKWRDEHPPLLVTDEYGSLKKGYTGEVLKAIQIQDPITDAWRLAAPGEYKGYEKRVVYVIVEPEQTESIEGAKQTDPQSIRGVWVAYSNWLLSELEDSGGVTPSSESSFEAGANWHANHIKQTHLPIEQVEKIFDSQSAGLEKSQKIFAEVAPNRTNPFDMLISNNAALLTRIRILIKPQ